MKGDALFRLVEADDLRGTGTAEELIRRYEEILEIDAQTGDREQAADVKARIRDLNRRSQGAANSGRPAQESVRAPQYTWKNWIRSIIALALGYATSSLLTTGLLLLLAYLLFPLLSDESPSRDGARLVVLGCFILADICGGVVTAWISRGNRVGHAVAVGILYGAWLVFQWSDTPPPLWDKLLTIVVVIPSYALGAQFYCRLRSRKGRPPA